MRAKTGKTQLQVAVEVGVTPQTVLHWEKGKMPTLDKAVRLAKVLGVSLDELCNAFGLTVDEPSEAAKTQNA
jgi:transcriptional regulator with XRE-family HTH domain